MRSLAVVNPDSGCVYTTAGSWAGKQVGTIGPNGHLRATRRYLDGSCVQRPLREIAWEAVVGHPLPEGWTLDYLDGDRANIAYRNLELISATVLNRRRTGGTANHWARFTAEQVRDIRASSETNAQLAVRYATSDVTIRRLRAGLSYTDVDPAAEVSD